MGGPGFRDVPLVRREGLKDARPRENACPPSRGKRVFQITIALVCLLLAISLYPGLIGSVVFSLLGVISILPLLAILFMFVGFTAVRELMQRRSLRSAFGLQAAAISVLAFGLVVLRVPMRLAFAVSRSAFEYFLRSNPTPAETDRMSAQVSRWFGIYHVDRWGHDTRGGHYFRTSTGSDMIDTMSYGFAFQPNPQGSPFGAAGYWRYRIVGDWHTFAVSDDYY